MAAYRGGTRVNNALKYDSANSVFSAFCKVVATYPAEAALVCNDVEITYAVLAEKAERVAAALYAAGVSQGDRIGVVATRSVDTIAALLGVLQAGGVYVPLDPSYAREQLEFIVQDATPNVILHMDKFADLSKEVCADAIPLISFTDALNNDHAAPDTWPNVPGQDPVYIMYTSGSTGKPKGVIVPHRGVTRLILGQPFAQFGPGDTSTHAATIAADASTWEIWCALLTGMRLSIVELEKPSLDELAEVMRRDDVTVGFFFAGLLHLMIDHQLDAFKNIRVLNTGGDVLSSKHARKVLELNPNCAMFNLYGPTENSAVGAYHQVKLEDLDGGPIPIGRPILNSDAFILTDKL